MQHYIIRETTVYYKSIVRRECIKRFEHVLFVFAAQASPLMTFCISVDRLIAIKFFRLYEKCSRTCYLMFTVGSVCMFTTTSCVVGVALLASDADYCSCSNITWHNIIRSQNGCNDSFDAQES